LKFTVPRRDLRRETFRCGGNGGQNVNKRDTGVRFTHLPSGAVGESCEQRTQGQNERLALKKLTESKKFLLWCKMHMAALEEGHRSIEAKVDDMMKDENLKIETYDPEAS
jgi:protein subunit release factor B